MPHAIDFRSFLHTPLRDLARGRVTGRLDYRRAIARAALPAPIAETIARTVRRARLRRHERATIADELIAHFADGLASGASADDLVRDFGDVEAAARLIRRATIRKRPLAWHALRWSRRLLAVFALLYAIAFARFLLGRPTVRVDYLAQANAAAAAVPEKDRAWPIYADVARTLLARDAEVYARLNAAEQAADPAVRDRFLIDATPADPQWPRLVALVESLRGDVERLRDASTKPLGFVLGRDGFEPAAPADLAAYRAKIPPWFSRSLVGVDGPPINGLHAIPHVLRADCRVARSRGDARRALADLDAMFALASQLDAPLARRRYASRSVCAFALAEVHATLAETPTLLDDAALVGLAHRVASIGGETATSLVDTRGTRAAFYDLIQRTYTDDGHGDGRPAREAIDARTIAWLHPWRDLGDDDVSGIATRTIARGVVAVAGSRRDVLAEFDRLMDAQDGLLARPLRDVEHDPSWITQHSLERLRASPAYLARFAPIVIAAWDLGAPAGRDANDAETLLGKRDGIEVGIALELHRRRHGAWPATLDALVPSLLPRVPIDRFDGRPVRYRLIAGAPVVYSVGNDRRDDGGRPAIDWRDRGCRPTPDAAAERRFDYAYPLRDGDWLLFDGRRVAPTTWAAE